MVATIYSLQSSGQAASYYEGDDYYSEGGEMPSRWFGAGAEQQGLTGPVAHDAFVAGLEGRTTSGEQLGTVRDDKLEHRPGWDMTFSAPKSVSIMAEVAGDQRLLDGHDKAVIAALSYVEKHAAATRIRTGGKVDTTGTGNLTAAIFRHDTSREVDPQLHSHTVILNMTQDKDGKWRSLESRELYRIYMKAGAIYRQHLAAEASRLGYTIVQGKGSLFELKGVSREVIEEFSKRSEQIKDGLDKRGKTRETATAQEKAVVTLDTRERKRDVDRSKLADHWRDRAAVLGFGEAERNALVAKSRRNARATDNVLQRGKAEAVATAAVAAAARSLSERQSVISAAQLVEKAGEFALGKIAPADVQKAITSAERRGELESRRFKDNRGVASRGYSTREAINTERKMLAVEGRSRGTIATPLPRIDAARIVARAVMASRDQGFRWTEDQKAAAKGILQSSNRVVGIQGLAGTAKTTTVIATYADTMRRQGHVLRAFAPTANAAAVLGEAARSGVAGQPEAVTVERLLIGGEKIIQEARAGAPEAWIVDEASMVSAKDMTRLLELSERANARLVLVGDVEQLGSVGAGRAFAQLMDAGMQVLKLEEIVRQVNVKTRDAVVAAIAGDGRRALEALDAGGGKVVERADVSDRVTQLARDFQALGADERAKTLVLDPSREGRDRVTDAIRSELTKSGALGAEKLQVSVLESRDMTREEARHARSYEVGDAVTFRRDYVRNGIAKGEAYAIRSIDAERNRITLADHQGQAIDWQLDKWGRGQSQSFAQVEKEFRAGDRLQFTRNDREANRVNGQIAHVINVDVEQRTMLLRDANGQERSLHVDNTSDRHLRHGWVSTVHSAQGATVKRVMAHVESFRANTVDSKSIYVALSRAKEEARLYTDDRSKLEGAISNRTVEKQSALAVKTASQKQSAETVATKSVDVGSAMVR